MHTVADFVLIVGIACLVGIMVGLLAFLIVMALGLVFKAVRSA